MAHRGALAQAMSVGAKKRQQQLQVTKRKRIFKRWAKSDAGQEFLRQATETAEIEEGETSEEVTDAPEETEEDSVDEDPEE